MHKQINGRIFCLLQKTLLYAILYKRDDCKGGKEDIMAIYSIVQLKETISPIAKEHGVKSVSLFGSYAKGVARNDSDIDLLIDKGQITSLFQLCSFRLAVEDALSMPVDLVTTESTDEWFLDRIQKDGILLYAT